MEKRNLMVLSCRWSIYTGMFFFFFACILGYASHVSIEALVKKAIIVGCLFGIAFLIMMRIVTGLIPDTIYEVNEKQGTNGNDSQGKTTVDST